MSAITTLLETSSELGFDTDDVCEAISYLANAEEIELWPIDDDVTADDITVTTSNNNNINICCNSVSDGQVKMCIEVRSNFITVIDTWYE